MDHPSLAKYSSLSEWFFRHAILPLLGVSGCMAVIFSIFIAFEITSQRNYQNSALDQYVDFLAIAMTQKNLTAAEASLGSLGAGVRSIKVQLCENNSLIFSVPPEFESRCLRRPVPFAYRVLHRNVPGQKQYSLSVVAPVFPMLNSNFFALLISIFALIVGATSILRKVRQRFQSEILNPLAEGLLSGAHLSIIELEDIRTRLNETVKLSIQTAVMKSVIERNEQVVHDIRSPLAVLSVLIKGGAFEGHPQRGLLESAVDRIQQIVTSLSKNGSRCESESALRPAMSRGRIGSIVKSMCLEKSAQYSRMAGVSIRADISHDWDLREPVRVVELERILSNLIDNAVDSLREVGTVRCSNRGSLDGFAEVSVIDDGIGIESANLPKLMERGATFGKSNGTGLGLYHARMQVESWGGSIRIESKVGLGTNVTLRIPVTAE